MSIRRLQNKEQTNDNYLTLEETKKIFPANDKTGMYIDFVRLRPKISQQLPGEHIKLTSEFTIHTAKENSVYNVVSKCAYQQPDIARNAAWEEQEDKMRSEEMNQDEIVFQKKISTCLTHNATLLMIVLILSRCH